MKNIPNKVFLQTLAGKVGEDVDCFNHLTSNYNISWNVSRIYEDDLKFISVSFLREKLEEIEDELKSVEGDSMSAGQKRIRLRGIKNMLNYLIKL